MDIANKRVLITGGSSGIGLALARALGKLGARVLLAARQEEGIGRSRNRNSVALPASVGCAICQISGIRCSRFPRDYCRPAAQLSARSAETAYTSVVVHLGLERMTRMQSALCASGA